MTKLLTDRAKELLKEKLEAGARTVQIPELGDDGGPLTVHVWPMTTREWEKIAIQSMPAHRCAMVIIMRAKNEDKSRMFSEYELDEILNSFPLDLLGAFSKRLMEDEEDPPELEQAKAEEGLDALMGKSRRTRISTPDSSSVPS